MNSLQDGRQIRILELITELTDNLQRFLTYALIISTKSDTRPRATACYSITENEICFTRFTAVNTEMRK